MINWHCTNEEMTIIVKIAKRVESEFTDYPDDRRTIIMDINACHSNGCTLRLGELLTADSFEFTHDIYGIRRHINRTTGKLQDCFVPRYAVQLVEE